MEILKIVACGVVYFLVVYLLVIRREARPIIPWAVCIASQVICSVFFYNLVDFFKRILPEEEYGNLGMVIPSGILCFGNLILIFVMFGIFMNSKQEKNTDLSKKAESFTAAPLANVLDMDSEKNESSVFSGKADVTMEYIRRMLADGRRDEAMKYLRMLAYYGKDEQAKAEAVRLMATINQNGEAK